jgi:polyhydroxybutyrate depolymerase
LATHPKVAPHHLLPSLVAHRPSSVRPNPPAAGGSEMATQAQTVSVEGVQRTYRAIVPLHLTKRLPLLIVLHGRGQSGSVVASQTGFLGLVEQRRVILVAPDGEQRSWNAGHGCCGVAGSRRIPDIPFVAALVADAVRRWPVDAERVYLVGYSNGGKLAYSEVCAHPTLFAAVATYGAVPLSPCQPGAAAVSFLIAAGTADQVLPFHGKPGGHPPLPAVPQAVAWLRTQDGCPGTAAVPFLLAAGSTDRVLPLQGKPGGKPPLPSMQQALAWLRSQDGCSDSAKPGRDGSAVVEQWAGCAAATEVESVVYEGHGHGWPAAGASGGSPSASTVMWAFLSRHDAPAVR